MTSVRAAVAVQRARIVPDTANAIRIGTIGEAVAIVVATVAARRLGWWGGRAAIGRTVALILAGITESIAADRRRAAVDLAIQGVLGTFAGGIAAAVGRRRVTAEEPLGSAARVGAIHRIGPGAVTTAKLLLRCADLFPIAVRGT